MTHNQGSEPNLMGPAADAWLISEPHPGHMLIMMANEVEGITWFLVSVDIEPLRVILRGVTPGTAPEDGVELDLIPDPLIVVEVPEGLHMEDFVQLPGELTRAVTRGLLVPRADFAVQWKTAVARTLGALRRRRGHKRSQVEILKQRTADKLTAQRRQKKRRDRKNRKGRR